MVAQGAAGAGVVAGAVTVFIYLMSRNVLYAAVTAVIFPIIVKNLGPFGAIRADPDTAKIPIIVVTSFALSGDDKKAMDAGASAYLAKPYSPRQLLDTIRKMAGDA